MLSNFGFICSNVYCITFTMYIIRSLNLYQLCTFVNLIHDQFVSPPPLFHWLVYYRRGNFCIFLFVVFIWKRDFKFNFVYLIIIDVSTRWWAQSSRTCCLESWWVFFIRVVVKHCWVTINFFVYSTKLFSFCFGFFQFSNWYLQFFKIFVHLFLIFCVGTLNELNFP